MDRLSLAVFDRLLPDHRVAPASHGRVRLSVAPRVVISSPNPGKGAATMMFVGEVWIRRRLSGRSCRSCGSRLWPGRDRFASHWWH